MKKVTVKNRLEWRAWLATHHDKETEIWLVFYRKETGETSIPYDAAVEEALCFGWIDSIIKKIDARRYVRKFTPRKSTSRWSALNIQRAKKMIQQGLMTEPGLRLVEAAKKNGQWENLVGKPKLNFQVHPEFTAALDANPEARRVFANLAPTYQKQYIGWIEVAKKEQTRQSRIEESIRLLEQGSKLGLK